MHDANCSYSKALFILGLGLGERHANLRGPTDCVGVVFDGVAYNRKVAIAWWNVLLTSTRFHK